MTEAKKIESKVDYTTWSVYKKLAYARQKVQSGGMKKSGKHQHRTKTGALVEYAYFELADFLPQTNEVFNEIGLCSEFKILNHGDAGSVAYLTVVNSDKPEEMIIFQSDTASVEMQTAIQSLGALHTYMRRYLWLEAMEIVEADMVDAPEAEEKPKRGMEKGKAEEKPVESPKPITEGQLKVLSKYLGTENMQKAFAYYHVERIEDLTVEQASNVIKAFVRKEAA